MPEVQTPAVDRRVYACRRPAPLPVLPKLQGDRKDLPTLRQEQVDHRVLKLRRRPNRLLQALLRECARFDLCARSRSRRRDLARAAWHRETSGYEPLRPRPGGGFAGTQAPPRRAAQGSEASADRPGSDLRARRLALRDLRRTGRGKRRYPRPHRPDLPRRGRSAVECAPGAFAV